MVGAAARPAMACMREERTPVTHTTTPTATGGTAVTVVVVAATSARVRNLSRTPPARDGGGAAFVYAANLDERTE